MRSMTGFGAGDVAARRRTAHAGASRAESPLSRRARAAAGRARGAGAFVEQLARERLDRGRFDVGVRLSESALPPPRFSLDARARPLRVAAEARRTSSRRERTCRSRRSRTFPSSCSSPPSPSADGVREALRRRVRAGARAPGRRCARREGRRARHASSRTRLATLRELVRGDARARCRARRRSARRSCASASSDLLAGAHGARPDAHRDRGRAASPIAPTSTEELAAPRQPLRPVRARCSASGSPSAGSSISCCRKSAARSTRSARRARTPSVAHLVVEAKTELERIREQVQNVE